MLRNFLFILVFIFYSTSCVSLKTGQTKNFIKRKKNKIILNDKEIFLQGICFGNFAWIKTSEPPLMHHNEKDYIRIKSWGVNVVRFYLNYNTFENDDAPYKYKKSGWDWLDKNIKWAKKYHIFIILNMHVPQGGHQPEGKGRNLWKIIDNQKRFIALWEAIAKRYKNEPIIAGYDLLNEPLVTDSIEQWKNLAEKTIAVIRKVDKNHLIIVEGILGIEERYNTMARAKNMFLVKDQNVMYTFLLIFFILNYKEVLIKIIIHNSILTIRRNRMKKSKIIILITMIFFITCMKISNTKETNLALKEKNNNLLEKSKCENITKSDDWANINHKKSFLLNNVWNKSSRKDYHQQIFKNCRNKHTIVGWSWSWPVSAFKIHAYPEIIFGDKPWDPWDTSKKLQNILPVPTSITDSKNLLVNYSLETKSTGVNNLSLSVWLTSSLPGIPKNITHEIMIWIDSNGWLESAGTRQGILKFNNITYDLYLHKDHGDDSGQSPQKWTYIAFKGRQPYLKGTINISYFINYLKKQGIVNNSSYINCVEMGNEVMYGEGTTKISKWEVTLQ